MQDAERRVAGVRIVHEHAHAVDVEHLRERVALLAHLLVGGVDRLLAPGHVGGDARALEAVADDVEQPVHHLAAVSPRRLDGAREDAEAQRVQMLEGEVLQLEIQGVEPQPVGDGSVDVERLARDALAMRRRHGIERAHVVQPVRELDQDDAHVLRHREQHLAEVLRLRFLARRELDLVQLRQPVDHVGHGLPERMLDLVLRDLGVLHHVVEERGGKPLRIEPPLRQDAGYREGMRDVGLARLAELAPVGGFREFERALDERDVGRREVMAEMPRELRYFRHTPLPRALRVSSAP